MRGIDRQIREIQREENKVKKSCKDAAKRNDIASSKILAKEIVQSRRAVSRLYANKVRSKRYVQGRLAFVVGKL